MSLIWNEYGYDYVYETMNVCSSRFEKAVDVLNKNIAHIDKLISR